jgi:hypothetical protein
MLRKWYNEVQLMKEMERCGEWPRSFHNPISAERIVTISTMIDDHWDIPKFVLFCVLQKQTPISRCFHSKTNL